jgi:hypothetical protein
MRHISTSATDSYRLTPSIRCGRHRTSFQLISKVTATGQLRHSAAPGVVCHISKSAMRTNTATGRLHHSAAAGIVCHISTSARSLLPACFITAQLPSSCIISAHQRGLSLIPAGCVTALPSSCVISAHQRGLSLLPVGCVTALMLSSCVISATNQLLRHCYCGCWALLQRCFLL